MGFDRVSLPLARRAVLAALSGGAWLAGRRAVAQRAYPTSRVTFEIPYPPGSGNDVVGRSVAARLPYYLGQGVVVENRPGASGFIASEYTRRAKPDGYNFVVASAVFAINPNITKEADYTLDDFTPVGLLGQAPFTVTVSKEMPVSDMKELIAYLKANPGKVSAGEGGPTGTAFFWLEALKKLTGTDFASVPYKGSPETLLDLISNRVQFTYASIASSQAYAKAGQLKEIAITGTKRNASFPGVATFIEQGFPTLDISSWFALLGPAHLPEAVVATMSAALDKTLADKAVVDAMAAQGIEAASMPPDKLKTYLQADMDAWTRRVRDIGYQKQ